MAYYVQNKSKTVKVIPGVCLRPQTANRLIPCTGEPQSTVLWHSGLRVRTLRFQLTNHDGRSRALAPKGREGFSESCKCCQPSTEV